MTVTDHMSFSNRRVYSGSAPAILTLTALQLIIVLLKTYGTIFTVLHLAALDVAPVVTEKRR